MQVDFEDGETGGRYVLRTEDGEAVSTFSKAGDNDLLPLESAFFSSLCSGFGPLLTFGDTPTG